MSVRVGDSSRRSEEIVKKISNCTFPCDYYYYNDDDDDDDDDNYY